MLISVLPAAVPRMDKPKWNIKCCNPFAKPDHLKRCRLRTVLPWMCQRMSTINLGDKICETCRKQLSKVPSTEVESLESVESGQEASVDELSAFESLESLNQCLGAIGETPVVRKKLQQAKYPREKI